MGRKKKRQTTKSTGRKSPTSSPRLKRQAVNGTANPALNELLSAVRRDPDDIKAALALAEYYNNHSGESKIVDILEPFEERYPIGDTPDQRTFDRLLAFGYAHAGRFEEAERTALRGLRNHPDGLDHLYVLTFVKLSLREYADAIAYGAKYLHALSMFEAGQPVTDDLTGTMAHLSQLQNFLGSAYQHVEKTDKAIAAFEASIKADIGNHLPFINLASLYRRMNRLEDAAKVIKRGLKSCRQVQELRLLEKTTRRRNTVSACMIVKDEEELLPDCLTSIRDWVDEIIVVDTGSTDRTVEIAQEYGAKVYHQPWEGDFSKHRNHSLEQATGDYIFIIDADERIIQDDIPLIKRVINEDKFPIISMNVFNVYGANQRRTTFLPSVRLFKRELGLRYDGIVHNRLSLPDGVPVARTAVRLRHLGYDLSKEKMEAKYWRSRRLLEKQLEENPDDIFALFNYAQLLRGEGDTFPKHNADAIMKAAGRAVELTDPKDHTTRHLHLMCLDQMAWTYANIGEYAKALEICDRALAIRPDYLDPLMLRAHVYSWTKEYDKAEKHFIKYLEVQAAYSPDKEVENLILVHPDSRATAYYSLGVINLIKENKDRAHDFFKKVTEIDPDYLDAWFKLGQGYLEAGEESLAESCFQHQLTTPNGHFDALVGLGQLSARRGDYGGAADHYTRALEIKEDDSRIRLKLGQMLQKLGQVDNAAGQFERAVQLVSDNAQALGELADAYFQLGRFQQALETYQKLVKAEPGNAEHRNDLANTLYKLGHFNEAEREYERAISSPECPTIALRNLGVVLARQGKLRESINALERYVTLVPNSAEAFHLIGDQYSRLQEYGRALPAYEKALASHPADALGLFNLSECYLHMGHRDSAILGYRRTLQIDPLFQPAKDRLDSLLESATRV